MSDVDGICNVCGEDTEGEYYSVCGGCHVIVCYDCAKDWNADGRPQGKVCPMYDVCKELDNA